ncbi:Ankyrin repeats (3 copies) [Popillia japonica]|uniref:Ankyrin repeats (3 copies) n=1 Tax=Popillia japonica TaxID=7064 RepID=A0AAW1HWQ6_POPJA
MYAPVIYLAYQGHREGLEDSALVLLQTFLGFASALGCVGFGLITVKPSSQCLISRQYLCQASMGERNSTHVENRVPSVKEVAAEDEIHVRSLQRSTDNIASSVGNKINVNIQSDDGSTPLHFAVVHEHLDIIHLLLKNGANGTTLDVNGNTPLHSAIFQQRADIVRLLLTKTEDVNVQGRLGYTPLHLSIQVQNVDILWLLLEFGATLNIQDKKGDDQIDVVRDKETVYDMWESLEKRYEKKGMPGHLMLRRTLMTMRLAEQDDLEVFLKDFDELRTSHAKTDTNDNEACRTR